MRALAGIDLFLFDEVAAVGHSGQFDDAFQRELAPAAAHFRPPQGGGQIPRFALQERLHVDEALDLAGKFAGGLATFAFQLFLARKRHFQGFDQLPDGFFALLERGRRNRLVAPEYFARQFEKSLAVGVERHT